MKTLARSPQRGRLLAAVAAVSATLSFAVAAAPASAAPVTYSASGGRTVEFSAKKFTAALPGTQRLTVKGTGWVGASPSSDSQPVVAFKLDNLDTLAGWGGDDRYVLPASPTTVAFKADNDTGNFTGWIDLPANLAKVGPGTGPNAGQHWLRILAGAFSTPGSTPNPAAASNVFGYIDAVDAPLTGFQGDDFFPGTFIPAGGATSLKVSGNLDTTVAGPVAVSFDGTTIANARNFGTQSALTTNANGDFTAAVPVPGGTTGGVKILSFTAGGTTQSVAITVTPRTAARQTPQTASVGDTVTVNGTGFRKIDGAGQKVGLLMMPGDVLLGCGTADAEGAVSVSGAIPAGTDLGDKSLWLAFGAACVARGPVVEPAAGLVQLTGAAGISVVVKPDPTPTPTPVPVVPAVPVPTGVPTPSPIPTPTPLPSAPQASKVKSTSKGSSLQITFGETAADTSLKVGAKTKSKVKLSSKGKAKIVTVAQTKTVKTSKGKAPKVVLKLTADGKKLLKARGSLKIVITIGQTGRATVTKTVTIKP